MVISCGPLTPHPAAAGTAVHGIWVSDNPDARDYYWFDGWPHLPTEDAPMHLKYVQSKGDYCENEFVDSAPPKIFPSMHQHMVLDPFAQFTSNQDPKRTQISMILFCALCTP